MKGVGAAGRGAKAINKGVILMFGIGSFNPVSLLATAALGPAGGIVAQLASQVLSQAAQQFVQQVGNNMGLPQSAIDFAQSSVAGQYGDFTGSARNLNEAVEQLGRESNASFSDIGEAQRTFQDSILRIAAEAADSDEAKEAKAGGRGGSWLRAIAEALGKSADKTAAKLEQQASRLDDASPSESAEYTADSQAFGMLMNAINTAIKAFGDALNTMARKQ